MKEKRGREGKNARAFGKCPTSNNTDLIKEMTHSLHASAFCKDYRPTDQSLLTNAQTGEDEHRRGHAEIRMSPEASGPGEGLMLAE